MKQPKTKPQTNENPEDVEATVSEWFGNLGPDGSELEVYVYDRQSNALVTTIQGAFDEKRLASEVGSPGAYQLVPRRADGSGKLAGRAKIVRLGTTMFPPHHDLSVPAQTGLPIRELMDQQWKMFSMVLETLKANAAANNGGMQGVDRLVGVLLDHKIKQQNFDWRVEQARQSAGQSGIAELLIEQVLNNPQASGLVQQILGGVQKLMAGNPPHQQTVNHSDPSVINSTPPEHSANASDKEVEMDMKGAVLLIYRPHVMAILEGLHNDQPVSEISEVFQRKIPKKFRLQAVEMEAEPCLELVCALYELPQATPEMIDRFQAMLDHWETVHGAKYYEAGGPDGVS